VPLVIAVERVFDAKLIRQSYRERESIYHRLPTDCCKDEIARILHIFLQICRVCFMQIQAFSASGKMIDDIINGRIRICSYLICWCLTPPVDGQLPEEGGRSALRANVDTMLFAPVMVLRTGKPKAPRPIRLHHLWAISMANDFLDFGQYLLFS
jgi:hypothetical protein